MERVTPVQPNIHIPAGQMIIIREGQYETRIIGLYKASVDITSQFLEEFIAQLPTYGKTMALLGNEDFRDYLLAEDQYDEECANSQCLLKALELQGYLKNITSWGLHLGDFNSLDISH